MSNPDPLAMRIKAIQSGDAIRQDLFDADVDHERAAVLGSAIDLAFEGVQVDFIDENDIALPIDDICGYGEKPGKIKKVMAAKTALKNAWSIGIRDVLINNYTDRALLETADSFCIPAEGAPPALPGPYPYLRARLNQGISTAGEESVNFVWTVPGVAGIDPDADGSARTAATRSLGTLRELAAIDRRHLGPALVALKGSTYLAGLHGEAISTKGRNLGYRLDLFTVDETGRAIFKQDPLDLTAADTSGKIWKVGDFGPDHIIPIGCPALKVRAFAAAARCVIDTFDMHQLWPEAQPDAQPS